MIGFHYADEASGEGSTTSKSSIWDRQMRQCLWETRPSHARGIGKKRNPTPEEALDLYFSLPDLESASEDDSEEECFEELPCELQSENDSGSDEVELAVPTVKHKKKPPRVYTGKQKKKRCSSTAGSSAAADASDSDMDVQWEMRPTDVVIPTDTEPTFSAKLSSESTALNAFELFVTDEVVNHIVDNTNLYASQEGTLGWIPLTAEELKAYFGMLVHECQSYAPGASVLEL
ncbi:hypothetical protein HPB52_012245 [Rhipicephalus sanguineus]|uniref:PiggyBac transposable element-derived protein domain-containing protein n=1 Tax=Rhipicephalus sanguineus TaxID=34632 RepID=A0A9D4T0M6_RHISA|nr:hypothetical protein HPB52_012245 [Rhipicephalus sanguineus]